MGRTLQSYIDNPIGKGSAAVSAIIREATASAYTEKFNNVLLRENGKIDYYKYKTGDNQYYIHMKIPSEVVKKFYYDVVFRFYADSSVADLGLNLFKYDFQAFSNDPAFVYTHAYVFNMNNLIVGDLISKMTKPAIKKEPNVKNPNKEIAYCKSLYFAYLFMKNRGLNKTSAWADAEVYDPTKLRNNVMDAAQKVALRQEEDKKLDKRKKILVDDKTAKRLAHNEYLSDRGKERLAVQTTKKTVTVKRTKAVNSTRTTKIIGKKK